MPGITTRTPVAQTRSVLNIMAKIKVSVRTNKVGSKCEKVFDEPFWDRLSDEEKEETAREVMFDMIDWDYGVIEGG
jgi:hypothetical protein